MKESNPAQEAQALQSMIAALQDLAPGARERIVETVVTFFDLGIGRGAVHRQSMARSHSTTTDGENDERLPDRNYPPFSSDVSPSPKEFVLSKRPSSDIERVAVLAFYLTHFRDTPQFKTLDISKLNTEAAQPKFSNAASSVNNAVTRGFLMTTTRGNRQLGAAGEQFVTWLPDRAAARDAMAAAIPRRRGSSSAKKGVKSKGAVRRG